MFTGCCLHAWKQFSESVWKRHRWNKNYDESGREYNYDIESVRDAIEGVLYYWCFETDREFFEIGYVYKYPKYEDSERKENVQVSNILYRCGVPEFSGVLQDVFILSNAISVKSMY